MTDFLEKRGNIAIIGTGISGLEIAYSLYLHHTIKIYEKNDYIGGHSRTIDVHTSDGKISIDTGLIALTINAITPYLVGPKK
ncbi:MAG: NAD(P)-binding protein [Alphaproteobacteria bacterium]